jgi:pimeloyl-ACP methyl ester carboxylesterase
VSGAGEAASAPPKSSGYVNAGALDMYCERHGEGPPLVLLHGAFGTIESCFADLVPRLARDFEVVAVELQGHGRTRDVDRPLSYHGMAADTAALVEALDIPRAHFVGYSMGGAVAVQLALDRPELVDHVVYAGGVSFDPSGVHPELTAWPRERLAALQVPTLLVIGDADVVRPEHVVEMFRLLGGGVPGDLAGLPRAQLAILPGTTHEGMLDRVDWLSSMIIEFLAT